MEEEIWKDIPGYEGLYQASDLGRIKRLDKFKWNGKGYQRLNEMILSLKVRKDGRLKIDLYKHNIFKTYLVHRLILETFVSPCPEGMECCHRDDNPSNNRLDNLYWGTRKDNETDKKRNGKTLKGLKNPNNKLSEQNVKEIKILIQENKLSQQKIADMFGVTQTLISRIKLNKIWK